MAAIDFKPPGPQAKAFMKSEAFVRIILGPVGSAKSSTGVMEMMRRLVTQRVNADGERRSRWAVIRNTNPMLRTTVMKTYADWFKPDTFGEPSMHVAPFEHKIDLDLGDGTRLVAEIYFVALDTADDIKKLLSLELTGALISEVREIPKTIVDGVTQRLRRYPALKDGGTAWTGLICDTNMPDDDHWLAIMSGLAPPPEDMSDDDIAALVKPANWEFFIQPPAMLERRDAAGRLQYEVNPEAENIHNLDPLYYPEQITGKPKSYIDVYILNKLGATHDGRPVQPDFNSQVHVSAERLEPIAHAPIVIGLDFGLTPAAIFMQRVRQQIVVFDEIVLTDGSAEELAVAVKNRCADRYPTNKPMLWGDPAGDQRAGTDKNTPFKVLRKHGFAARPVESNDPEIRRGAGRAVLTRMQGGHPGIVFGSNVKITVAGLAGAWNYKRVRGTNGGFQDEPQKNRYSHPCEAWEYGLMGMGEGRRHVGQGQTKQRSAPVARPDPLGRLQRSRISRRR